MLKLVKFEDIAAVLGLEKTGFDDYPGMKQLVALVYSAIESYTMRTLELGQQTEEVQCDGYLVALRALPIESITSVSVDGVAVDATACVRRADGIKLPGPASGLVSVVYRGGLGSAPDQLKRAALMQVLHEWARKDQLGARSTSSEGGFISWPEVMLLEEARRVLNQFVHPAKDV